MEWVTTGRGSRAAAGYALPGLNKAIWSNLVSSLDSLSVKTSIQNKWSALCWSKTLWNSGLNTPGPPCNSACYGQMWGHPSLPGGVGSICRPLIDPCWSRGGAVWGPLVRQDSSLRPGHEDWLWSFFRPHLVSSPHKNGMDQNSFSCQNSFLYIKSDWGAFFWVCQAIPGLLFKYIFLLGVLPGLKTKPVSNHHYLSA